jgi:hypothetical protein
MVKDTQANIKLSSQQKENLKNLGIGVTECFEKGYELLMEKYRSELEKIVEKSRKEYIRVYTKLQDFDKKIVENEDKKIQKIIKMVNNSYNPEFFIGKEIEGIHVTKQLLEEGNK